MLVEEFDDVADFSSSVIGITLGQVILVNPAGGGGLLTAENVLSQVVVVLALCVELDALTSPLT